MQKQLILFFILCDSFIRARAHAHICTQSFKRMAIPKNSLGKPGHVQCLRVLFFAGEARGNATLNNPPCSSLFDCIISSLCECL